MLSLESISGRTTFYEEIKMPELLQTLLFKLWELIEEFFSFQVNVFLNTKTLTIKTLEEKVSVSFSVLNV